MTNHSPTPQFILVGALPAPRHDKEEASNKILIHSADGLPFHSWFYCLLFVIGLDTRPKDTTRGNKTRVVL